MTEVRLLSGAWRLVNSQGLFLSLLTLLLSLLNLRNPIFLWKTVTFMQEGIKQERNCWKHGSEPDLRRS